MSGKLFSKVDLRYDVDNMDKILDQEDLVN